MSPAAIAAAVSAAVRRVISRPVTVLTERLTPPRRGCGAPGTGRARRPARRRAPPPGSDPVAPSSSRITLVSGTECDVGGMSSAATSATRATDVMITSSWPANRSSSSSDSASRASRARWATSARLIVTSCRASGRHVLAGRDTRHRRGRASPTILRGAGSDGLAVGRWSVRRAAAAGSPRGPRATSRPRRPAAPGSAASPAPGRSRTPRSRSSDARRLDALGDDRQAERVAEIDDRAHDRVVLLRAGAVTEPLDERAVDLDLLRRAAA